MKNIIKGIAIFSSLLLIAGCNNESEELKKEVLKVDKTGEQIARNYFKVDDDTIIYTDYNSIQYEEKELDELLRNKEIDIYDLIDKTELLSIANDGGSKLYQDGNVYISVCNSLDGNGNNHNIYIMGNKSYVANMCTFDISKLEECMRNTLNGYLVSKKVSSKNGKLKDITDNTNYEKIIYKKSSLGEFMVIKTNDEELLGNLNKYFKKKNKKYYYSSFAIYLDETYHIYFYNNKNSQIEEKIDKCINESWKNVSE